MHSSSAIPSVLPEHWPGYPDHGTFSHSAFCQDQTRRRLVPPLRDHQETALQLMHRYTNERFRATTVFTEALEPLFQLDAIILIFVPNHHKPGVRHDPVRQLDRNGLFQILLAFMGNAQNETSAGRILGNRRSSASLAEGYSSRNTRLIIRDDTGGSLRRRPTANSEH